MINLSLRTEYSFKKTFGKMSKLMLHSNDEEYLGIADINNTFGHIKLEKLCKKNNVKPIYGVKLQVVPNRDIRTRGVRGPFYTFIAKNDDGLKEVYDLVKMAWDNFYYEPMLPMEEMLDCTDNVFVIASNPVSMERLDYIALDNTTPKCVIGLDVPKVFMNNNFYPFAWDKQTYELMCGARKHGEHSFRYQFENQTYPMHVLTEAEFASFFHYLDVETLASAIKNTYKIAEQCDAKIAVAPMVKYHSEFDLMKMCRMGALKLKVDLSGEYGERLIREVEVITAKDYPDYFAIVAEMVVKAKKKMFVGPARGSSAGSLVCYLLEITTVDPIYHDLMFERFIDVNRDDLPDIDVDFPDNKRQLVIKDLFKTYGEENVFHISNINTLGPKSALDEFGMALSIAKYKIEEVKDNIIDRSGGADRAEFALADTLDETEQGKSLIAEYPKMELVKKVEGHAKFAGKHAAGIIVCNDDLTNYCGVNSRENTVMVDKHGAEDKNLLKIDCLGLRTLSVLEEAAKIIGEGNSFYYNMEIDDVETFEIFKEMRLSGIFQFEGQSMQMLCKKMKMETFNDIVALTALSRPGPLHSGAANTYVEGRNSGKFEFVCNHPQYVKHTKATMGVIVYQEQLMQICREVGGMEWVDVQAIRRGASKTYGKKFFEQYSSKFLEGAERKGIKKNEAAAIWENMLSFGAWGMNKSHSVSYAYISYWCAYMKRHHPLAFTVATLNNSKTESSSIKILRDAVENDGLKYVPVDPDNSLINWSIVDGEMVGGLTNIKGIAEKKAKEIIKTRNGDMRFTPSILEKLSDPQTPYDILYPTKHFWGPIYENPFKYGLAKSPVMINDIDTNADGIYTVIGKVILKDLRDLNEYNEVVKRGGKVMSDNHLFLRIVIEDDTNQIMCKIGRYDYERLRGAYYARDLKVDESWLLIKGKISKGWRILNIDAIFDLSTLDMGEDENEQD